MSGFWRENAALCKRLTKIHLNPPILHYGFKESLEKTDWRSAMNGH